MKRSIVITTILLASCNAHEHHQADGGIDAGKTGSSWLCYCDSVAMTCVNGEPICDATDPSKRLGCACRATGPCNETADCIEVHAPKEN